MSLDLVLRRPHHHLTARIDDETLVLDPGRRAFHVLSPSAALVYSAVGGTSSARSIATALVGDVDVDPDVLLRDIADAVDVMIEEGLLVGDDPSSDAAGLPRLPVAGAAEQVRPYRTHPAGAIVSPGPVRCGATSVEVRTDIAEIAALLAEPLALLPSASPTDEVDAVVSVTDPGDGGPFEIHVDGVTMLSGASVDDASEAVLATCNHVATERPRGALRLHGGAVSLDGRTLVVCGPSGAGKSTTTAAMVQRGWRYVTDEVVVIDPTAFVVTPYPKWIDLSGPSLGLLGIDATAGIGPRSAKDHVPPALIGTVEHDHTVATTIVLLTGDDPTNGNEPARRLDAKEAVAVMLGNVFATTWDQPEGLQALVDLCRNTVVVQMARSDPAAMAAQIAALLDAPADSVST